MSHSELPSARVVGGDGKAQELAIKTVLARRMSADDQAAYDEYMQQSRRRQRLWKLAATGVVAIIVICRSCV